MRLASSPCGFLAVFSIWLLAAEPAEPSGEDEASRGMPPGVRQRLAEQLPASEGDLADVAMDANGGVAAVRLSHGSGPGTVYLFERNAGGADRWGLVAEITAPDESHFGDALMLGKNTLLVASPDTAGAGLGPGVAYVFQRHVGGSSRWGLVARLAPAPYPPKGAVEIRYEPTAPQEPGPSARLPGPALPSQKPPEEPNLRPGFSARLPGAGASGSGTRVVVLPPVESLEAGSEMATGDDEPELASPESPPRVPEKEPAVQEIEEPVARAVAAERREPPAADGSQRFIVVGNMREEQRAVRWAADLRQKGYRSEVFRNARGYFVVTLDRLPLEQARSKRIHAVSAGDVPGNTYLIEGTSFREKISF